MFDVYHQSSLKAEIRSKRGRGVRRRVTKEGKIPSNWQNFLRVNDNKVELFNFLADKIAHMSSQNVVIVTKEEDAVSNHTINLAGVAPCSHEESDTRILYMTDMQQKQAAKPATQMYRSAITNPATLGPGGCRIIHFSGLLID